MNNEEKERLKEWVGRVPTFYATLNDVKENEKNIQKLISLIDRQPSEEEATEAWNVLQRGLSRCESVNEKACARCSKFKGCQEGEETIRKALGGEEFDE